MPRYLPVSIAAILSAVTVVAGFHYWDTPVPESSLHGSAPDAADAADLDDNLGAPFTSYESATLHYRVRYPSSWVMNDRHEHDAIDILSEPRGQAVITISKKDDPALCDPWRLEHMVQTLESAAAYDPTMTQTSYAKVPWKQHWTVMGSGRREHEDGSWYVRTFIVARPEYGGTLNITTQIKSDFETLFGDDVQAILDSLSVVTGEY